MNIPFLDLTRGVEEMRAELDQAIGETLDRRDPIAKAERGFLRAGFINVLTR